MNLFGLRTIKTAITIFLCLAVFMILKSFELIPSVPEGFSTNWFNPFFAALAGCYSLGDSKKTSISQAKNRCIASLIGGIVGILLIFLYNLTGLSWPSLASIDILSYNFLLPYLLVAIFSTFVITIGILLKQQKAIFVALLTFLSVTINPGTIVDNWEFQFGINRILSTIVGVLLALLVNFMHLPHFHKNKNLMFIINIDEILKSDDDTFKGYIKYKLNNFLEQGIEYTFYTTRTPSTYMNLIKEYDLNNDIISMNGACTYNIKELSYQNEIYLSDIAIEELNNIFKELDITPFINVIKDNVQYIYSKQINNNAEETYEALKKNAPYVNYIKGETINDNIMYYLLLEKEEIIDELLEKLKNTQIHNEIECETFEFLNTYQTTEKLKYIKIFSKDICDLKHLKNHYNKEICFISNDLNNGISEIADYIVTNNDYDKMFKLAEKLYYKKGKQNDKFIK